MTDKDDVEEFLNEFQTLANVFGILVINREKNTKALTDLGISPHIRKEIIMDLKVDNYFRGPSKDKSRSQFIVWEFGANLDDGREVYIKLSCRREKNKLICLSFHTPEHIINYPFRSK